MTGLYRTSRLLKAAGIVLLCLCFVLFLYGMANSGGAFDLMRTYCSENGMQLGLSQRLQFNDRYYRAMTEGIKTRGLSTESRMGAGQGFEEMLLPVRKAQKAKEEESIRASIARIGEKLDLSELAGRIESLEDVQDQETLRKVFEYIDGLAAPKKGKAAALKAASQRPYFEEFYKKAREAYGERAGTLAQFMSVIEAQIKQAKEQGTALRDVRAFAEGLDLDGLLPQSWDEEEGKEGENLVLSLAQGLKEGRPCAELLEEQYGRIREKRPDLDSERDRYRYYMVLPQLLESEQFDGSYASVLSAMEAYASGEKDTDAFLESLTGKVLSDSDARIGIPFAGGLWTLTAHCTGIGLLGLLLLALGLALSALVRHMAAKQVKGTEQSGDELLRVSHLCQYFKSGESINRAVDDVSFTVRRGEVFGLVGESGCGKTTTGRTVIGLYDSTSGEVVFDGLPVSSTRNGLGVRQRALREEAARDIRNLKAKGQGQDAVRARRRQLRSDLARAEEEALLSQARKEQAVALYRQRRVKQARQNGGNVALAKRANILTQMQMIFQDPIASINPRMTVREIIAEGLVIQGMRDKKEINRRVDEMLEKVGLVREHGDRYPHEFSGGQRQRIGIARAVIMQPELIIADEPISALDVSIQAQVINLLNELRESMGLTILFIAHNLSVVKYFSDRIAVMYFGHIVEMASSDELFAHPLHPYTRSLLSAIPYPDPDYEKSRVRIPYDPAKAHDYSTEKPELREVAPEHFVYCSETEFARYRQELGL